MWAVYFVSFIIILFILPYSTLVCCGCLKVFCKRRWTGFIIICDLVGFHHIFHCAFWTITLKMVNGNNKGTETGVLNILWRTAVSYSKEHIHYLSGYFALKPGRWEQHIQGSKKVTKIFRQYPWEEHRCHYGWSCRMPPFRRTYEKQELMKAFGRPWLLFQCHFIFYFYQPIPPSSAHLQPHLFVPNHFMETLWIDFFRV